MQDKLILSIFFGQHDSCVTFANKKEILLHLEAERILRKKHVLVNIKEMEEIVNVGLKYLNTKIENIETVLLAKFGNKFILNNFSILGKKFTPITTSHHANHIGTIVPLDFENSLIFCIDGGSEDGNPKMYFKKGKEVSLLKEITEPMLNGRFYGRLTQMIIDPDYIKACDFYPGKTMGLAALGNSSKEFHDLLVANEKDMNTLYYNSCIHLNMKFNISMNYKNVWLDKRRCDLAFTAQKMWIEGFLKNITEFRHLSENICLTGGCALNVTLNSELAKTGWFKNIYVSPVSGDDGQSLGAILYHFPHIKCDYPFLGRGFGEVENTDETINNAVRDLLDHKIIAWYEGRSEIGARALGHRSFLGLPDSIDMRIKLSEKVKGREPYRPVSAILIEEFIPKFTNELTLSPFMTFAPKVREKIKKDLPAIVHYDGTSRIQTLNKTNNPVLYKILEKVGEKTGYPVLMNTSFNIAGEPIVDTPEDAINTFNKCLADVLYINGRKIKKQFT